MKSLKEFILESKIEHINEGLSKKATELMKHIYNYFKKVHPNNCNKITKDFYQYIVDNCEKVELSKTYKELKDNSYMIFQKSKTNPEDFLSIIFTRPNKIDDKNEIDSVCFSGFVDSSFYDNLTFEQISSLKNFFKEYKRGCPIEIYSVDEKDAFSTNTKSNLRFDLHAELYNN